MKITVFAAASAAIMLLTAVPASAQTYNSDVRQLRQEQRIDRAYRNGRLTPREVRRLDRQQDRVQRIESRARYNNGGYIDPRSRHRIDRIQDRASRNIYRKSHNRRGW